MKRFDNLLLVAGIGIVVLGIGLVLFRKLSAPQQPALLPMPSPTVVAEKKVLSVEEQILNGTIVIPESGALIQLDNGVGTASAGTTTQVKFIEIVGKTLTQKDNQDVFGSFAVNYGGSGSFVYVGLWNATPSGTAFTSATESLGDRIIVEVATASAQMSPSYDLTVSYLGRKPTDAMTVPPTVSASRVFKVKDHFITL